jgi:diadenosine tetraphosphatase ApaH/serine/threonine PP2A family protein phosphatase
LSHRSFEWTKAACSATTKHVLASLPFRVDLHPLGGHASGPGIVLVHGTPTLNTVYWHESRSDEFCLKMAEHAGLKSGDVIAFGHTHLPWHRIIDGIHFVNTGSVGRPKDGDKRAGYVVLSVVEEGSIQVEHVRVAYDVDRATAAIRASDLPDEFAWYLESGGKRLDP